MAPHYLLGIVTLLGFVAWRARRRESGERARGVRTATLLAEKAKDSALRARAEEAKCALLDIVSHDLRTPLAVIAAAATTLRDEPDHVSIEQREDLVGTICDEAVRLERLVTNLLSIIRMDSGALGLCRAWTSFEEMVSSVTARMEDRLGDRVVSIAARDEVTPLYVDTLLLGQVFWNLFDNVVKHTPREANIAVSARYVVDKIVIDVADDGPGLAPALQARVFDRFFRGENAGPRSAGLGLSICRGIVEAHGGTLHAVAGCAEGAVFRMELPVELNAPEVPTEPSFSGDGPAESVRHP